MTQQRPITPPEELMQKWMDMWPVESLVAAAQWGADQELEACCEWLEHKVLLQHQHDVVLSLRAARRPKPPSLKEQALEALEAHFAALQAGEPTYRPSYKAVIRRALEALPDD